MFVTPTPHPTHTLRPHPAQVQEAVREYEKVGAKHGLSCTELALAWCKSRWFVASSIIGATSMEQLKVSGCVWGGGVVDSSPN